MPKAASELNFLTSITGLPAGSTAGVPAPAVEQWYQTRRSRRSSSYSSGNSAKDSSSSFFAGHRADVWHPGHHQVLAVLGEHFPAGRDDLDVDRVGDRQRNLAHDVIESEQVVRAPMLVGEAGERRPLAEH